MKDEYYLDTGIAGRYDEEVGDFKADLDFYLGLAKEADRKGQKVLELAVGTGRVAIPIARSGIQTIGLDRSPAMLEVARGKAEGLTNLTLVEGDMADFDLGEQVGLVYIPARSFLALLTVEDQKSCLRAAHRHLLPGGRLALNFFNPDIPLMATWMTSKRDGLQRQFDLPRPGGSREVQWSTRKYLTSGQLIDEQRIDELLSDTGAVISRVYRGLRLRYVFRYEMQHLLELTGFEVEALYGGFQGEPFTDTSTEMVWVARRPVEG